MIEYTYLFSLADVGDVDDIVKLSTKDNFNLAVGHRETTRHRGGKWLGGYTADFKIVDSSVDDFTIGWKNTRDDYCLIITNNDVVGQPNVNTYYVAIPGTSKILDMSDYISSVPTYGQRELTFDFAFEADPDIYLEIFSDFANEIHGRRIWIRLDQDPSYLYRGRASCGPVKRTLSICKFTMTVTCDPMKYEYFEGTKNESGVYIQPPEIIDYGGRL